MTTQQILQGIHDWTLQKVVYDVSEKNPTAGPNNDGKFTLEYILSHADTLIPTAVRKPGMSIKFVHSVDNKYVQYRLMSDSFNTTVANWQGVDEEPTAGSDNLIKSGGCAEKIQDADFRLNVYNNDINVNIFENGYIDCTVNPITFNRVISSGWKSAIIAVKSGESYNVKCRSTSASAFGIAVFNEDRELLSHQDGTGTVVTVTIEQDGFLVVNHGHSSVPSLSRIKTYSLEEKRNLLTNWILSESYRLRGNASYTDGVINSPITIYYPDESYGEITLTRNSDGLVTELSATSLQLALKLILSITRNTDGTVKSQSISFQGL